jgi:3-oxoacid CoA-transferase B subunit
MSTRELTDEEKDLLHRAGEEMRHGMVANLGIGLPQYLPSFIPERCDITFHSENGFTGMGEGDPKGTPDSAVIDAGGRACTVIQGAAFFDSLMSFAIVRGGNLDLAVLGAFEVGVNGDLANWKIPGKLTPGMGGATELAQKANHVMVISRHVDKQGRSKIVPRVRLPLTAPTCVDTLVTERAVFRRRDGALTLTSVHPDYTLDDVLGCLECDLPVADSMEIWERRLE